MSSFDTLRSVAQKTLPEGLSVVPSTLTAVISKDAWVFQITVSNNTGGAVTFLVQDQQATPLILVPTISVAANTVSIIPFPEGVKMIGGIKWQAGAASSLHAEIFGFSL